ncbi:MAG TPA: DUF3336 domain-containing protein [Nevskiaceae bacterium]|nr:DUF3336 domain-containing protein [Nevskiaceae bacterium]
MRNSKRRDPRVREYRRAMGQATDYGVWREAAQALDAAEGTDAWKQQPRERAYNWRLIHARYAAVRKLLDERDARGLIYELRQGLHWNLGNFGNPYLYRRAHFGTKQLIEDYVRVVSQALEYICECDDRTVPRAERLRFFLDTAQSYGRSALMLSGGATLGLFHVGVVKALYREGLLPEVISGSSAGAVVAATVGTRTSAQLEGLLDPEQAYYYFWRRLRWREMFSRGVLMDQAQLRRAIERNVHDLSFEEARRLSGLSVNITVSAAGHNQSPRLLNHLTYPHLLLREAVLASCAVPLLFEPVMLCTRDIHGERAPYRPLLRWNDGSLESDLPAQRLRRLFNVNHNVVSQTNPHVLPFLRRRAGSDGSSGFVDSLEQFAVSSLRLEAQQLLKLGGGSVPSRALRRLLDRAAAILGQEYRGNITVLPDLSIWRYARVTSNPDLRSVQRFILEGERATWPHIEAVRIQTLVERALARCIQHIEGTRGGISGESRSPGLKVVRSQGPQPARRFDRPA